VVYEGLLVLLLRLSFLKCVAVCCGVLQYAGREERFH